MEQNHSWETKSLSYLSIFSEPEGSLPSLQEPTTGPYPENLQLRNVCWKTGYITENRGIAVVMIPYA